MKAHLKSIIELLSRDANQLECHAQKLRQISPTFLSILNRTPINKRAASTRKRDEILEQLGIGIHQPEDRTGCMTFISGGETCRTPARDEKSPSG
jgi:hypothetical protein